MKEFALVVIEVEPLGDNAIAIRSPDLPELNASHKDGAAALKALPSTIETLFRAKGHYVEVHWPIIFSGMVAKLPYPYAQTLVIERVPEKLSCGCEVERGSDGHVVSYSLSVDMEAHRHFAERQAGMERHAQAEELARKSAEKRITSRLKTMEALREAIDSLLTGKKKEAQQ